MKKNNFLLFFVIVLLASCSGQKKSDIKGVFVGKNYGKNFKIILPRILNFKQEGKLEMLNLYDNIELKEKKWFRKKDSLYINNESYYYTYNENTLVLKDTASSYYYYKKQKDEQLDGSFKPLNAQSIYFKKKKNLDNDFVTDEYWTFIKDSVKILKSYYYNATFCYAEQQTYSYILKPYLGINYLILKNKKTTVKLYKMWQKNKRLFLYDYKNNETIIGREKKVPYNKIPYTPFQIKEERRIFPYYGFGKLPQYPKGWNIFKEEMIKHLGDKIEGKNGYITLRFVLNNIGKAGQFQLEQMDRYYQPCFYNESLIKKIINKIATTNFLPGIHNGEALDCQFFLIFKIQNNTITDVFI